MKAHTNITRIESGTGNAAAGRTDGSPPKEIAGEVSAENTDIRKQVESNRGTAKKLELLIPGVRTYRTLDDLRVSDELLRGQVADRLDQAKSVLESLRKQLVASADFSSLTAVGGLISQIQQFSGEVRHSQQGYSGIAATIRIDQEKLNRLYDYDLDFVGSAFELQEGASHLTAGTATFASQLSSLAGSLATVTKKWAVRMETVEGLILGQGDNK